MANWLSRLQTRWGLPTLNQTILVLIVFACTGFTVLFLKKPIFWVLGIDKVLTGWLGTIIYLVVILPLYQIILLVYGFIFGQFRFFWEFEKKMFRRMSGAKPSKE
jgi:hypothetical protein